MSATVAIATPAAPAALRAPGTDIVRGIALITFCYFLMTLSDVAVKFALPVAGLAACVLARGAVGSVTVLAIGASTGRPGLARLMPVRWGLVMLRSVLQAVCAVAWFAAWETMTLADSYAVGFTTPLLATLFAVLLIGEKLDAQRIIATIVGFAGVLVMLRPDGNLWTPALVPLLISVTASAFARLLSRTLSTTETPECLSFWLLLMHIPLGVGLLFYAPIHALPAPTIAALLALGVIAAVAQIINARAYACAPVSALGPFDYSSMLWAVALGWLCFGETPQPASVQGAVIIAGAGLYSFHAERQRQRRARAAA